MSLGVPTVENSLARTCQKAPLLIDEPVENAENVNFYDVEVRMPPQSPKSKRGKRHKPLQRTHTQQPEAKGGGFFERKTEEARKFGMKAGQSFLRTQTIRATQMIKLEKEEMRKKIDSKKKHWRQGAIRSLFHF